MIRSCLYYVIFFNISLSSIIRLIFLFSYLLSLRYREPNTGRSLELIIYQSTNFNISQKKLPLLEEKSPTPQHLSKLVNNNTILNLNIASYFLNILASQDASTWSTIGGPMNKTIKHLGLTIPSSSQIIKNVSYG